MAPATSQETAGMILVVVFSTISNFAATGMLFWISTQKTTNVLVSRLVINLLVSDWLQSIGFLMSLNWIANEEITPGTYCDIQGILIEIGDVASGFWAASICLHSYIVIVHSYEPKRFLQMLMSIIWPLNICLGFAGFLIQKPGTNFYNSAGGSWCWIGSDYAPYRLSLHYGIILFLAFCMIILYVAMFSMILSRKKLLEVEATKKALQKTGMKLIYYPAAYMILVFPLALQRILGLTGITTPFPYLIIAGAIFASAGTVNSLIYGTQKNVISLKPVFDLVPKASKKTLSGLQEKQSLEVALPLERPKIMQKRPSIATVEEAFHSEFTRGYVLPYEHAGQPGVSRTVSDDAYRDFMALVERHHLPEHIVNDFLGFFNAYSVLPNPQLPTNEGPGSYHENYYGITEERY